MATKHDDACLGKAADDEPIFVLRSSDKLAPALVRLWAELAIVNGCPMGKVREAYAQASRMDQYARQHYRGGKFPD